MSDVALVVLAAVAIAVGIAGTVLPFVPGLGLIVAATLVFGIVDGFGRTGALAFGSIVAVAIAGTVAGIVLPHRSAGRAGAPRSSLLVGALGAVIGFFAIPVVGAPIGGVVGIYLSERSRTGDADAAWRTTRGAIKGFGLGAAAQLAAALLMAAIWVGWVIVG